jgi:hypothetical protein
MMGQPSAIAAPGAAPEARGRVSADVEARVRVRVMHHHGGAPPDGLLEQRCHGDDLRVGARVCAVSVTGAGAAGVNNPADSGVYAHHSP